MDAVEGLEAANRRMADALAEHRRLLGEMQRLGAAATWAPSSAVKTPLAIAYSSSLLVQPNADAYAQLAIETQKENSHLAGLYAQVMSNDRIQASLATWAPTAPSPTASHPLTMP